MNKAGFFNLLREPSFVMLFLVEAKHVGSEPFREKNVGFNIHCFEGDVWWPPTIIMMFCLSGHVLHVTEQ